MDKLNEIVAYEINNLANQIHIANEKWWACTRCNENGFIQEYGQLVVGGTTPVKVFIQCPFCDGTKKLNRNVGELLALVHSELSEALEGDRKNLNDDKLPHRKMMEVEIADAIIRLLDVGAGFEMDIGGALVEKFNYNLIREDHKLENRMKEGGKKY